MYTSIANVRGVGRKSAVKANMLIVVLFCLAVVIGKYMPSDSRTIRAIPILAFFTGCMLMKGYFTPKRMKLWFIGIVAITMSVWLHGILPAKDLFMTVVSFLGLSYMWSKIGFKADHIYIYLLVCYLPVSLYSLATGEAHYFPTAEMQIDLGVGPTKHYTATVGTLMFMASFFNINIKNRYGRSKHIKFDYLMAFLGIYVIFFSTSRSQMLAVCCFAVICFVNRLWFRPMLTTVLAVGFCIGVYFMEMLSQYADFFAQIPVLGEFMHTDNFNNHYGVTSGRAFLWSYHWQQFVDSNFFGTGRIEWGEDNWIGSLGIVAPAKGESPFTGCLACYGFIGVGLLIVYASFFYYAVRKRNLLATGISFFMIFTTVSGWNMCDPVSNDCIMFYLLYYISFLPEYSIQHLYLRRGKKGIRQCG